MKILVKKGTLSPTKPSKVTGLSMNSRIRRTIRLAGAVMVVMGIAVGSGCGGEEPAETPNQNLSVDEKRQIEGLKLNPSKISSAGIGF